MQKIIKSVLALFLIMLSGYGQAEVDSVHVVKLLNFSCSVCRAFENVDSKIENVVQNQGGKFVRAPLSWGTQTDFRDKFYYAVRNKYPANIANEVSLALYSGAQENGLLFENYHQIVVWLQQAKPELNLNWQDVVIEADNPNVQESVNKSIQMAVSNGVSQLPAYILIQGGQIKAIYDPNNPATNKPYLMVDEISKKIATLSIK